MFMIHLLEPEDMVARLAVRGLIQVLAGQARVDWASWRAATRVCLPRRECAASSSCLVDLDGWMCAARRRASPVT